MEIPCKNEVISLISSRLLIGGSEDGAWGWGVLPE